MLKVLDVRMKRGVDLADHLVGYYQGAQGRSVVGASLVGMVPL